MSPLPTAPARSPAQEVQLRTAYLREVLAVLYPGGAGGRRLLVLPHPRRPRLLVPEAPRRLVAAAVRHCTEPRRGRDRLARHLTATALRAGAGRFLRRGALAVEPAGSLESHLGDALDEPVALGIHIGPARANRKPVAQLLDPAGRIRGYAKLGVNPLTQLLVGAETAALHQLAAARLRQVSVPRVRLAGEWRGGALLVQEALPVWRRRGPLNRDRLGLAMREVAYCGPVTRGPLAAGPYWRQLTARVAAVSPQPEGAALAAAVARLGGRAGDLELRYGCWHGDWAPWNMAVLPETLLVWDWERFGTGVPVGFDAVHFDLQLRLAGSPDAAAAVAGMLAGADRLLGPFDVPAPARPVTALLYLADLAARYLTDRQAQAGARLGVLGSWLLPVLTTRLEELS